MTAAGADGAPAMPASISNAIKEQVVPRRYGNRSLVEPHDQPIVFDKRIAGDRRLDLIARQRVEARTELLGNLVLPLLDRVAGRDDQISVEIAAGGGDAWLSCLQYGTLVGIGRPALKPGANCNKIKLTRYPQSCLVYDAPGAMSLSGLTADNRNKYCGGIDREKLGSSKRRSGSVFQT
jgi:hypothetical protein